MEAFIKIASLEWAGAPIAVWAIGVVALLSAGGLIVVLCFKRLHFKLVLKKLTLEFIADR